ncbi:MAG: NAD-dependent malic enzyme [bacterium]|nr:NAD-dependent malic enzyme [bacterium]
MKSKSEKLKEKSLLLHKKLRGKITIESKIPVTKDNLSLLYTPGVAEPCREIAKNKDLVFEYTSRSNLIAIVTDGSAVLGLGNIGPEAGLPVMEGKAILFKKFGGVNAVPICLATQDTDEIVNIVKNISPTFGGINLEDISAPRCFEIEKRLIKETDIPIFHDDQHGTEIVVLAGLINALKLVKKEISKVKITINGAGAAGTAICKCLYNFGARNIIVCDIYGAIYEGMKEGMNSSRKELVKITNRKKEKGKLGDVIKNADVFIGVSAGNILNKKMVASMNKNPIIFAMANPDPEILPKEAKAGGTKIIATGRSDFPNQINNVLAFPGIFRGVLDVRAKVINEEMKIAASLAISSLVSKKELTEEYFIPKAYDPRVAPVVAEAVAQAAIKSGVARIKLKPGEVFKKTVTLLKNENNKKR